MRFSIHNHTRTLAEAVKRAQHAERLGFDGIFFADGAIGLPDAFLLLATCARETKRIRVGNAVTNMIYRHPYTLATSAATLNEIADGRAVLGVATGDGAAYGLGRKATPVAEFEAGLRTIRALVKGGEISIPSGMELKSDIKVSLGIDKLPVPIYVSAEGPRMLRLCGKLADGVILGTGFDLRVLDWARARIAEGAEEEGRNVSEVEVVVAGMFCMDDDGDRARETIRDRLANRAHHNFRFTFETVPPEELAGVKRFMAAFDMSQALEEKVDPAVVNEYLTQRFSIAGTPAECIARVRALERAGATHLMITAPDRMFMQMTEAWSKHVFPHFLN